MYKLCFYVLETHLETVKAALFTQGAGQYKNYDQCCWQTLGEGQFRPLANSKPFVGDFQTLEKVPEYKVEMVCDERFIKSVVKTLLEVHPYEEPAYEVYKIMTENDL